MATLTTQNILRTGTQVTFAGATGGGDAMEVGDGMVLHVKNAGGGSINVTLVAAAPTSLNNVLFKDQVVAVGAGVEKEIGPVSATPYKDPVTGLCTITYSGVTSVTVAAKKLVG